MGALGSLAATAAAATPHTLAARLPHRKGQ